MKKCWFKVFRSPFFCLFVYAVLIAFPAQAEVVYLNDGSILLGELAEARGTKLVYDTLGTKIEINGKDVLRTEKELSSLGERRYDITLTDGMVFTGSIADYDPEIGLFVTLSIGSLTLPASGVKSIVDREARRLWVGSDVSFSVAEHYSWFIDNDYFGPSLTTSLAASFRLPWRGWTAGAMFDWTPLDYTASTEVSYSIFSAAPRIGYRVLDLKRAKGILSKLSPFALLGAGPAYIAVADDRPGAIAKAYGSVAFQATAELGLDIVPLPWLSFRLSAKPIAIVQAGTPFVGIGAGLGATWEIQ